MRESYAHSASCIGVIDSGRNLVGFGRNDDVILASVEVSVAKACTGGR